ncbi:hypothetical protein [Singulisphaera acidiphila]|nr:hypothetical protein [Singulisphaera acidiphila]
MRRKTVGYRQEAPGIGHGEDAARFQNRRTWVVRNSVIDRLNVVEIIPLP